MARLAIATKDIVTERFSVKAGEPLPPKYQVASALDWVRKNYGANSLRIAASTRKSLKDLEQEFAMVSAHRDELTARLNELEKKLKSQTGRNAGMKEQNGNSQG